MKRAAIAARKVGKARVLRDLRRGEKPFRGAQGPRGPKDPKDLRGSKGLLLREAETLAEREERSPAAA